MGTTGNHDQKARKASKAPGMEESPVAAKALEGEEAPDVAGKASKAGKGWFNRGRSEDSHSRSAAAPNAGLGRRRRKFINLGIVIALVTAAILGVAWVLVPGGQDFLSLDAAYINEAKCLGRAVGQATFTEFDPDSISFLIIKKGGRNYLVGYSGQEKVAGEIVRADGVTALNMHKPVITIPVATILPVRPSLSLSDAEVFNTPGKEMAATAPGRTLLAGRLISEIQVSKASRGQEGLLSALSAPVLPDSAIPSDLYVMVLVHEAFHVYQWDRVSRWMQEISAKYAGMHDNGQDALERCYQDAEIQDLQHQEGEWLVKAIYAEDERMVQEFAKKFLSTRSERRQKMEALLGPDAALAIDVERVQEWMEGLARYMEIRAWQVGSSQQYQANSLVAKDPAFHGYKKGKSSTGIAWGADELIEEIRRASRGANAWYTLGSGEALLLDRLDVGWHKEAMLPTALEDMVSNLAGKNLGK